MSEGVVSNASGLLVQERVVLKMLIQGVDYEQLDVDLALRRDFEASVKDAILSEQPDLREDEVAIELSRGSVVVKALISLGGRPSTTTAAPLLPPASSCRRSGAVAASDLEQALRSSEKLLVRRALERVQALPRLSSLATGELSATFLGVEVEKQFLHDSPEKEQVNGVRGEKNGGCSEQGWMPAASDSDSAEQEFAVEK